VKSLCAYLVTAAVASTPELSATSYSHDLSGALAALVTLIAVLTVIALVVRAVYLTLKHFTRAAGPVTTSLVLVIVLIGVLNR
jgi:hypothetical protein